MKRLSSLFLVLAVLMLSVQVAAQVNSNDLAYWERHNVGANWGDAFWFGNPGLTVNVSGLDNAHVYAGSSAMKAQWTTNGDPANYAGVRTNEFLTEDSTGLSTGFSAQVYVERVSGTGVPMIKLEATSEAGAGMGGADTLLTLDAWTTVNLPAANITSDYKHLGFVFIENGSSGQFDFWIDDIRRDGAVWDDFEQEPVTRFVPSNIDGAWRGESSMGGGALSVPGPSATQGGHVFGMEWSGDTDGNVEIQNVFNPAIDLTGSTMINLDAYIPGSTLPGQVQIFFWDGDSGAWSQADNLVGNNTWDTLEFDISGLSSVPGFDMSNISEAKIVLNSMTSGKIFIDNMQSKDPVAMVNSILRAGDDPTTDAAEVDFAVTFSESVSGFTGDDCTLTTTGKISGAFVSAVTPAGPSSSYLVTVNTGSGDGNIRLDIIDDDSITDSGGFPLGGAGIGNGDFYDGEWIAIYRSAPPASVGDLLEEYETHNLWTVTGFGESQISIQGYDSTHFSQGAEALMIDYTTSSTPSFRGIQSQEFPQEVGTHLSTGFSVDIYVEAQAGATGMLLAKIELVRAEGGGNDASGDIPLSAGWNTINVMPSKNYKTVYVIFIDGSASGTFHIWLDNILRNGVVWEGFESTNNTQIFPSSIEGGVVSERTLGGVTLADPGPIPIQGNHAFRMTWNGDSDGKVEVNHLYSSLDLSGYDFAYLDIFIPNDVPIPSSFGIFFTDGSLGSFHSGTVTDKGAWEQVEINLTGLDAAIDITSITEMKVVFEGVGAEGTIYLDNLQIFDDTSSVSDWTMIMY